MRAGRNREVEQMSTRISKHIRSNVIGYIAIFMFALGGTAYATHPGGKETIDSADIIDNEVFSADVANDTLAGGGLGAADLAPDSVGTSEVAPNSIGSGEVLSESLTSVDIAADSIGSSELGLNAVGTNEVATDSLTSLDIAADSIGFSELGLNSVGSGEVLPESLTSVDIAADSIGSSELGLNAVGTNEVATDSLNSSDVGANAVGSSEVANASLGTAEFASSIPATRATRGSQGIPSGTSTKANFTSEFYDTANLHSTSSNLSRLTAPVTGIYEVSAGIMWAANSFGFRSMYLERNGNVLLADETEEAGSAPGGAVSQSLSTVVRLTAGQYVQAEVFQNSGGNRSILSLPEASPYFSMTWLAPGP
jgi:hypothetical protein